MDTKKNNKFNRRLTLINADRFFENGRADFSTPNLRTSVFICGSPFFPIYSRPFVSIRGFAWRMSSPDDAMLSGINALQSSQ
jgi:hypothetical protein